jgi:hypothetical protein
MFLHTVREGSCDSMNRPNKPTDDDKQHTPNEADSKLDSGGVREALHKTKET